MNGQVKLHFALEQDEDGYPPFAVESVWATLTNKTNEYVIDNIPFYVRGVALGDVVSAKADDDGHLWFHEVINPSGHSTLRILMLHPDETEEIKSFLCSLGCRWEGSNTPKLFSVDVPPEVKYDAVKSYLDGKEEEGVVEYEEGCLGFE
jgi:hypothetical protein